MSPSSNNDVPGWSEDAALVWSPERELSVTPPQPAPRIGPWSPPEPVIETLEDEIADTALYWPWRLGLGLAQGFLFFWFFRSRAEGGWPGSDAFLFDAIALPALFVPWMLMAGLGRAPLPRLLAFAGIATAILAMLGWYHRWRILGVGHGQSGLSMLVLAALALFIGQSFLHAWNKGRRDVPAELFSAGWALAARILILLLALGLGLLLVNSPLLPRHTLERGDIIAMPLLGLCGALAFQLTALPRVSAALTQGLIATATILLPPAIAASLFVFGSALTSEPPALILLLALMSGLSIAIAASWRDGARRPAWREGLEVFGALLLPVLGALAVWALAQRVAAQGWTAPRMFAAAWTALLCACAIGYASAALTGLVRGGGMKGIGAINASLAAMALLGALALGSPLADPLRLAPAAQAARLEQGRVAVEHFDFANLAQGGTRFSNQALAALAHSLYPDIAHAAQGQQLPGGRMLAAPNPTEIGAGIAVRTPGARLPATLLARDWRNVAGVPRCLTRASESCEAFFLDLNGDHRQEILLVTGGEGRWWGAVMEEDAAGRWRMAGRLTAGCGATLSDLRAGRFSVLSALPGWNDLSVAGGRLSVMSSGTGCSHY